MPSGHENAANAEFILYIIFTKYDVTIAAIMQ